MTIFIMILVANSVTLLITVIAAIRSPSWSYRLLLVVSLVSTLFALHQFVTGRYHLATLIVSALLLGLLTLRGGNHLEEIQQSLRTRNHSQSVEIVGSRKKHSKS